MQMHSLFPVKIDPGEKKLCMDLFYVLVKSSGQRLEDLCRQQTSTSPLSQRKQEAEKPTPFDIHSYSL